MFMCVCHSVPFYNMQLGYQEDYYVCINKWLSLESHQHIGLSLNHSLRS